MGLTRFVIATPDLIRGKQSSAVAPTLDCRVASLLAMTIPAHGVGLYGL
jgi:hypothetical protein